MSGIILFQFPGACSRVTMSALEETGVSFEDRMVNLRTDAQFAPDYLALNPKGKVPVLVWQDKVMTENAAILWFLHRQYPAAGLLPSFDAPADQHQLLSDLVWCSSTLHPIVRQVRAPQKWTTSETAGIIADGMAKMALTCKTLSEKLSGERWWYGENWSITDVYLYWVYSTCEKGGFPLTDYPALVDHAARVRARPSVGRALTRETQAAQKNGLDFKA